MAKSLALTPEEAKWRDQLDRLVTAFPLSGEFETRTKALTEIRDLSRKLHQSLKSRGHEPRHHRYMIENRGLKPDHPDFYNHIHPAQDLVKFTRDPHANDDPEDKTIGAEFEINISCRRWGRDNTYRMKRTESGWRILVVSGDMLCDKSGEPALFESLRHDTIAYPIGVGMWFEWIWDKAEEKGLSTAEVQQMLNQVAEWISGTERSAPRHGHWAGLTSP